MFWLLLGLLLVCALCSWFLPDSPVARSAARAFDTSVLLLSSDDGLQPRRAVAASKPRREARRCDDRCEEEEASDAVPGEANRRSPRSAAQIHSLHQIWPDSRFFIFDKIRSEHQQAIRSYVLFGIHMQKPFMPVIHVYYVP